MLFTLRFNDRAPIFPNDFSGDIPYESSELAITVESENSDCSLGGNVTLTNDYTHPDGICSAGPTPYNYMYMVGLVKFTDTTECHDNQALDLVETAQDVCLSIKALAPGFATHEEAVAD